MRMGVLPSLASGNEAIYWVLTRERARGRIEIGKFGEVGTCVPKPFLTSAGKLLPVVFLGQDTTGAMPLCTK